MDRKKALYVREPFLIKLKAKDQPQHPINHRLMEQVDPQTVSAKKGKPFRIGNDKPIEEAKTGKRSFLPRTKTDMAAAENSQKTESCCYKIRGNRKGLSDTVHVEVR